MKRTRQFLKTRLQIIGLRFLVALIVWSPPMTSLPATSCAFEFELLMQRAALRVCPQTESAASVLQTLTVSCLLCGKTRPVNVTNCVCSLRWHIRPQSAAYAGACVRPPNYPSFLPSQSLQTHRARRKRRRQRRHWRTGARPCLKKC